MAKEPIEFKDFAKECKFRTYQENKCVNEKNKNYRQPGSCQEVDCPIFKEGKKEPVTGGESAAGTK